VDWGEDGECEEVGNDSSDKAKILRGSIYIKQCKKRKDRRK
jgi:hypothetical protein